MKNNSVVAIGASAGGLAALRKLFEAIPSETGLAFVVVIHLSPDHESRLAEVLQPSAAIPVQQVTENTLLEPNHVYVIPPGYNLTAVDTHLRLDILEPERRQRAPIDHFFRTLAQTHDGESIAIILTGTGSDGTLGLKEIKRRGGIVIVQDPSDAEYDGMPYSAVSTGLVDLVLPLSEIPAKVLSIARTRRNIALPSDSDAIPDEQQAILQKISAQLRTQIGLDFTRYKKPAILAQIKRRMQLRQILELNEYMQCLREERNEAQALSDDLLISTTSFFRGPSVYDRLQRDIVPKLLEHKGCHDEVRLWSVGCATGEEAYSLAILMVEKLAELSSPPKFQLFASDMHEHSLVKAREGFYAGDIASDVSPQRLERFFKKEQRGYRIRKDIRERVVFTPHTLWSDPPFSRIDLIVCVNTLRFLQPEVQKDMLSIFHYALRSDGYLVLGGADEIETSGLFDTAFETDKIFRKSPRGSTEPRVGTFSHITSHFYSPQNHVPLADANVGYGPLHAKMVAQFTPPTLLVTPDDKVAHITERAGRYLFHPEGEMTANVLDLVREELRAELRSLLYWAREQKTSITSKAIRVAIGAEPSRVILDARPATDLDFNGYVLVIFNEQPIEAKEHGDSNLGKLSTEAPLPVERMEKLVNELRAQLEVSQQRLQSVIEKSESNHEEMKASNEELQSVNEELRSTMEELETSKEELQSMNEELQTVNQENRHKVEELAQMSSDLQNLLAATSIATLFLDRNLRILRFTPAVSELFNIRMADRGRPLSNFTHRLGYDELMSDCSQVLHSLNPVEHEIQDNSSHWYLTRILPYRSMEDRIEGVVITLVDITKRKESEQSLRQTQERYRLLVEGATEYALLMLDAEGRIHLWNRGAERMFGYRESEITGQPLSILDDEQLGAVDRMQVGLNEARNAGHSTSESWQRRRDGSAFWGGGVITAIPNEEGENTGFAVVIRDNTERSRSERLIRESEARLRLACQATGFGSYDYDLKTDRAIWSPELYQMLQLPEGGLINSMVLIDYVHPDDRAHFTEHFQKTIRQGGCQHYDHQFRVIINNQIRWLRDIGHVFCVGEGEERQPVRVVGMVQDVTSQKEYESSLERARKTAEAANQSRGEFLANMSHEIRTPMTAILGHVDILGEELSDPDQRSYLETIRRNGKFLLRIINDILDLSKIDADKLLIECDRVRLDQLLADVRSLMDLRAEEKGLQLSVEFDGLVPQTIEVDAIRLRQILLNLLGNAIKFTHSGSVRLIVRFLSNTSQLQFDVIDTGIGIPHELVDELFKPFSQADATTTRNYGGTGLGLTICRRLAKMFGGDISIESELGRGSKFSLVIDCRPDANVSFVHPDLSQILPLESFPNQYQLEARILVADDRRDIRFLVTRILEGAGAAVETANNGHEAVEKVQASMREGNDFDIVVIDMQMPQMDGYDATRSMRQLGFLRPVIAVTANAMRGDRERCVAAGCSDYLSKPIKGSELLRVVSEWLTLSKTVPSDPCS